MNINITLFIEMVIFSGFVMLTMRHIWPPIMAGINTRQQEILDGLEKGQQGRLLLAKAEEDAQAIIKKAQHQAGTIAHEAHEQAHQILEDVQQLCRRQKEDALKDQTIALAKARDDDMQNLAQVTLQAAVQISEKLLGNQLTATQHKSLNQHLMNLADDTSST